MKIITLLSLIFCVSNSANAVTAFTSIDQLLNHSFTNKDGESLSVDSKGNAVLQQKKSSTKGILKPGADGVFFFQVAGLPEEAIVVAGGSLTEEEGKSEESLAAFGKPIKTLLIVFFAMDAEGRSLSLAE